MLFAVTDHGFNVIDDNVVKGAFKIHREDGNLFIDLEIEQEYYKLLTIERFLYENRSEYVNMWIELIDPIYDKLMAIGWQRTGHVKTRKRTIFHRLNKIC
jgi:hypothetical protein